MEAQITKKPIKIAFCLSLLFLVRYIFVFGFEKFTIADFSIQNSLSLILSCALAPIFSLLMALILIKYINPYSKASAVLLMLLIADPLPLSGIKIFFTLIAGILILLCILLIQRKAEKTIILILVAAVSVVAVYIAPEMLFSLFPMTVAICLAESGEVSVSVKAISAATVILGIISAIASSLHLHYGTISKRRYYGVRPLDFVLNGSYSSNTLPNMFTVFIISAPVIIVTIYFSVKLISIIYKDSHGGKCYREVRAEHLAEKAAKKEQHGELKIRYKEYQKEKSKKTQKQKTTVPKKATKEATKNEEKSVIGKPRITLNKQYVWRLALIVCPVLICIIGRILFGNSGVIVASFNLTPLLVLLTLKTNGDKYMQPLFNDFELIIKKHSLFIALSVIYLAGCTAYSVSTQINFSGGMNDLFYQISNYLI